MRIACSALFVLLAACSANGGSNDEPADPGSGGQSGAGGSAMGVAGVSGVGGSGAGVAGASGSGSGAAGAGTSGSAGAAGTSGGSAGAAGGSGNGASGSGASGAAGMATAGASGSGSAGVAGNGAGGGGNAGAAGNGGAGGTATAGAGGTSGGAGTSGSAGTGGSSASFYIGADITDQENAPSAAQDNLLSQMKAHGFNWVRLRTFVDPKASDGYDKTNGFDDIAHTVTFGKKIKAAGMGLLIDFHYSDNWADPGKQCIPIAWQGYTTIDQLSTALHDYTKDAIQKLIAGGARPDMVQIGNETTPGMLLHHCDSGGQPLTGQTIPVTGAASTAGWPNLGKLLKAGIAGVKEVDTGIVVSFHIDRGNAFATTKSWIDNAVKQGAVPEAFGESCYQKYQGDPNSVANTVNGWTTTFGQLVTTYPNIKFFAAEYGPLERQINDVLFNLPNKQGIGTFNWEPTTQGDWNAAQPSDPAGTGSHALFTRNGNTYTTRPDLALYDQMKIDYASRL